MKKSALFLSAVLLILFSTIFSLTASAAPSYSVSWIDKINEVTETNAKVGKICVLSGVNNYSVSRVGIYLYSSNDALIGKKIESTENAGFLGESRVHIWYDINSELGIVLAKGTTYKYKLMVEINGAAVYSPVFAFTTAGCNHNYVYTGGTRATCTEKGTEEYKCEKCFESKTEYPNALGHSFGTTYTVDKEATCLETGLKSIHCERCSETTGVTTIPAKGHNWDTGATTTEATCGKTGVRTFICENCSEQKTETIAKTNKHSFSNNCDNSCNICGYTRSVTHNYGTNWESDKDGHWHECSACGKSDAKKSHTPGPEATESSAQTCTDCGYVIKVAVGHVHNYGSNWKYNSENHWNECSCGSKNSEKNHTFSNSCDTSCDTCGYTRNITHNFSTKLESNKEGHWHECSVCGKSDGKKPHTPGPEATSTSAQTCTACGYVIKAAVGHAHNYENEWKYNSENHWYECACGSRTEEANHKFNDKANAYCNVCNYSKVLDFVPIENESVNSAQNQPDESVDTDKSSNLNYTAIIIVSLCVTIIIIAICATIIIVTKRR